MDVARSPQHARKRRRRRWLIGRRAVLALGRPRSASRLHPPVPTVERAPSGPTPCAAADDPAGARPGHARAGGNPLDRRRTDARVERIVVFPGATVHADTLLLVLSNPELKQSALDADAAVTAAQARLVNLRAQLESHSLERQAAFAKAQGDRDTAVAQVEVDERLSKQGLIAPVELKKSQIAAKELTACCDIERQRVDFTASPSSRRSPSRRANSTRPRRRPRCKHSQLDALQVRAGMAGVLQQVPVEVGQRVPPGRTSPASPIPPSSRRRSKFPKPRRATSSRACPCRWIPATGSSTATSRGWTRPCRRAPCWRT